MLQKVLKLKRILYVTASVLFLSQIGFLQQVMAMERADNDPPDLQNEQMNQHQAIEEKPDVQPFAIGKASGRITWNNIYSSPVIKLVDIGYVYCVQPPKPIPNGNMYNQGMTVKHAGIRSLLQAGFPYYQGKLSDHQAYIRTFVALNAFIGTFHRQTIESYHDDYVNYLLQQADKAVDLPPAVRVKEPKQSTMLYNAKTERLETGLYHTKGEQGNVWFKQLPANIYPIDEQGKQVQKVPVGSPFRFVTKDLSLNGTVAFQMHTDIKTMEAVRFQAEGVQDLMALQPRKAIPPIYLRFFAQRPASKAVESTQTQAPPNEHPQPTTTASIAKKNDTQPVLPRTGENSWHQVCVFAIFVYFASMSYLASGWGRIGIARVKSKA